MIDEWTFQLETPVRNITLSSHQERPEYVPQTTTLTDDEEEQLLLTTRSSGFTLSSPFWKFQSNNLLQIALRPAWQAIPEYTNQKATEIFCCCRKPIDWSHFVWTREDVVDVQEIPQMTVQGVGICHGVKVRLKPLSIEIPDPPNPQLAQALERHVERMKPASRSKKRHPPTIPIGPTIIFAMSETETDAPLVAQVHFPGLEKAIAVQTITVLDGTLHASPTHVYIHGYQSWSFSGSVAKGEPQPKSALPPVFSGAFNHGGDPPPESVDRSFYYRSDFFTCVTSDTPDHAKTRSNRLFPYQQLDETGGPAFLLGWLAQKEQFGIIQMDKQLSKFQMHASCDGQILLPGHSIDTDWMYLQLVTPHSYDEEPLAHFLHSVAAHNHARPLTNGSLLTGWCSWYHYYENISEGSLRENFAKLATMRTKVPTNVSIVDDGYMTAWGDWDSLKKGKFSSTEGMGIVARDIEAYGMRPGLWMAPFAADKHSKLVKHHPDWILRNDIGRPANSSNCGKFFYGLDATNPEVREHAARCIERATDKWSYNVLKLDFLYAACLSGNSRYDLSQSRAQAMHLAMKTIRKAAGPTTFIIGCGCPIGSAIGYIDGMRVSADTGPTWYPPLPLPWWDQGTLPCLRSMIRNSMSRAPLSHRWWHNDPDCLLLGESTRLTDVEVASAASIVAMTCGMMLLSDDLTKVSPSRIVILTKIFPMTGVPGVVLDLHNTKDGLPSLLRLWCTDKRKLLDQFRESRETYVTSSDDEFLDHNAEATFFARQASFSIDESVPPLNERRRSCIDVTKGLGTWTILSVSNWSSRSEIIHIPPHALLPPPSLDLSASDTFLTGKTENGKAKHGYHVFSFWSRRYTWMPEYSRDQPEHVSDQTLTRRLASHETEIIHVRPVTPEKPQYIGSDLHFTCGREVKRYLLSGSTLRIVLETDFHRVGSVYLFIPRQNIESLRIRVNSEVCRFTTIGNTPVVNGNGSPRLVGRVIQIPVIVHGDGRENDGFIDVDF